MKPLIIVNFKTYKQATGNEAVKLAIECDRVARSDKNAEIALAVQAADIGRVSEAVGIRVFAQHVDGAGCGKSTGHVTAESVKAAGAAGTLLNHAEHKLEHSTLRESLNHCKENKLKTVVCAADNKEAAAIAKMKPGPDCIAVEPPELIGTLVSVSKANPEIVLKSVAAVRKNADIPVLCGAGIANRDDIRKALKLGAKGILVATAVVCAANPGKALKELAEGCR